MLMQNAPKFCRVGSARCWTDLLPQFLFRNILIAELLVVRISIEKERGSSLTMDDRVRPQPPPLFEECRRAIEKRSSMSI